MKKSVFVVVLVFFFSFVGYGQRTNNSSFKKSESLQTNIKVKKRPSVQSVDVREKSMEKFKNMEQYRKEHNVPEDFPRYIDTGNPKIDLVNYYNAKQKWIKKNPERFEKIKTLNL